jgi:hypothetical protein
MSSVGTGGGSVAGGGGALGRRGIPWAPARYFIAFCTNSGVTAAP